jgi:hypothetical protein
MDYGLLLLLCLASLSGCSPQASEAQIQEPIVTINDLQLTATDLQQELAVSPSAGPDLVSAAK